jgi:hypothetical protein
MATVPLSGTNIRLLSGVPFSNDYKHSDGLIPVPHKKLIS